MKSELYKAIAVTAEVVGTDLSEAAAKSIAEELGQFEEAQVIGALKRCRAELRSRLTLAEILNRIDDGRPGPDEAWGMITWDECETVVITTEMQKAQAAAWSLWEHDRAGARFAFKEAYVAACQQNRAERKPVQWIVEQGWDNSRREAPIKEAVLKGRISMDLAERMLPAPTINEIQGSIRQRVLELAKAKEIAA